MTDVIYVIFQIKMTKDKPFDVSNELQSKNGTTTSCSKSVNVSNMNSNRNTNPDMQKPKQTLYSILHFGLSLKRVHGFFVMETQK